MRVKAAITGGGTGGHLYPALAVMHRLCPSSEPPKEGERDPAVGQARALNDASGGPRPDGLCAFYVGSSRGLEKNLVSRERAPTFLFPMAPPTSLFGLALLPLATLRCIALLIRRRPRVTFATGGYVSIPLALASWLLRIPIVLFLPDVVPGRAVSRLTPLARRVAVTSDASLRYLPAEKTIVTGYPVRDAFLDLTKSRAREFFAIPDEALVLLAFGGSQGSRAINTALASVLPETLERAHVIHVAGQQRFVEVEPVAANLTDEQRTRYHVFPYLQERDMALALEAADLALCRSGAAVLAELPITSTAGILVPLPEPGVHQRQNAEYLADHGAAVIVDDDRLEIDLPPLLSALLKDQERLSRMSEAAAALARPEAAADIVALINEVAA